MSVAPLFPKVAHHFQNSQNGFPTNGAPGQDDSHSSVPLTAVYVVQCPYHQGDQDAGHAKRPLATLMTILLTTLTLLLVLLFIQMSLTPLSPFNLEVQSNLARNVTGQQEDVTYLSHVRDRREAKVIESGNHSKLIQYRHKRKQRQNRLKKFRVRRSNQCPCSQTNRRIASVRRRINRTEDRVNELLLAIGRTQTGTRVAVHLGYTRTAPHNLFYRGYLVWSLDRHAPGRPFFHYSWAPDHEQDRDIYGVRVQLEGQYQIYSQVLVNGRVRDNETDFIPFDCAQETILKRNNNISVIIKSSVTQVDYGDPRPVVGLAHDVHPKDSSFQMGVFLLHPGDEIRIRVNENCNHFRYAGDELGSYFGLIRI